MGDIGDERVHYEVLPIDEPAPAVEPLVEPVPADEPVTSR